MSKNTGRNDPCPCGSGKKYKKCCYANDQSTQAEFKTQYRFEPGSYGDVGEFMPSISCLKSTQSGAWEYHFVLANPSQVVAEEDAAVNTAHDDLAAAFERKNRGGSDAALAGELKSKGYVSIKGFNIIGNGKLQA